MLIHRRANSENVSVHSVPYGSNNSMKSEFDSLPTKEKDNLTIDDKYHKPPSRFFFFGSHTKSHKAGISIEKNDHSIRTISIICVVLLIVICGQDMISLKAKNKNVHGIKKELENASDSFNLLRSETLEKMNEVVRNLQRDINQLQKDNANLKVELSESQDSLLKDKNINEVKVNKHLETENIKLKGMLDETLKQKEELQRTAENREKAIKKRFATLHDTIQQISLVEVTEKFGEGPYRVEFTGYTNIQGSDDKANFRFVVELAPLLVMPHSIHLFLHIIDLKLYKGVEIHHDQNSHVAFGTIHKSKPFVESGYFKLSFSEYNDKYPHNKYTIGFAGRPGGPNFYINLKDNDHVHGPGGQEQHDLEEEADSCFGTVVEGVDAIDKFIEFSQNKSHAVSVVSDTRLI